MKKKYRLLKKSDFSSVLNNRKKIFSKNFVCIWKKDSNIENIKIGIIIPKKKCKKSVDRNYLKRIFWYLHNQQKLELPNVKCVFFYNKCFFDNYYKKIFLVKELNDEIKKIYLELIDKNNENIF